MKKCNMCKDYKSLDNFHKDKSRKNDLSNKCKECKSITDKIYREKNKDKKKTYSYNYYLNNKEKYQNYNERRRELHKKDPRIRLRGGAKGRASKKNIEFNLPTYKDLPKVPKYCPVFKTLLVVGRDKNSNGGGTDDSPSLDRIDNTKGYIKGNIQVISRKANQMKSNGTFNDIESLYFYMKKQNNSCK